jgi:predicted nucleotidyltransferase
MGSLGAPVRQDAALSAIARHLATTREVLGALVVGSMAAGTADAASDVDLIVCAHPGRFEEAWQIRNRMHVTGALASWDDKGDSDAEIGVHRWVTSDLILVEALFATPGSGVRLGRPWMVIAGETRVAACCPLRSSIDRAEFDPPEMAHRVDHALDTQKTTPVGTPSRRSGEQVRPLRYEPYGASPTQAQIAQRPAPEAAPLNISVRGRFDEGKRYCAAMQSTWHRLSSRLSGEGGLIGIDWRDAISPNLEESLRRWTGWQVGPHFLKMELSYYDQVRPNSLISLLDLRVPDFKGSDDTETYSTPYIREGKLKARFIAYETPIELLPDIVDAVLHLQVGFVNPLSFTPALDLGRKVLAELLEDSPVLRMRADGNGLERWSDVIVEEAFAEAVRSAEMADRSGSADRHLRTAWECVHAAEPDPVRSYSEAIKAVETAAHAVTEPNNPNATLGSIIRELRTHPESVSLAISG